MATRPNVFILSVDSLQWDFFSDAAAELAAQMDAVEFTNAVATAPETSSAMPGLAAGVFDDSLDGQGLTESGDPQPIAELLSEAGYSTAMWTDNFLFGAEYNYDRGFDGGNLGRPTWKKRMANTVRDSPLSPAFGAFEWAYFQIFQRLRNSIGSDTESFYRTARQLNANALDWLDGLDNGPHFCWLHYMDVHHPYEPPQEYLEQVSFDSPRSRSELGQFTRNVIKSNGEGYSNTEVEDAATAYRACCLYLRDELMRFVSTLQEQNHFDPERDVLVFTADHGECLTPEKFGMLGHVPPAFWEEIVRVPLVINRPDWSATTIDDQVSLIDMMPTILEAVDVPVPDNVEGVPRSSPSEMRRKRAISVSNPFTSGETVRFYRSIRKDNGWKLFGSEHDPTDREVLSKYGSVPSEEDPVYICEHGDTPDGDRERWDKLADELGRGPLLEVAKSSNKSTEIDEEHLRNLGYLE